MHYILERYLIKTIAFATGLAVLIILGVLFLMLLLGEFKNIGEGDYGLFSALIYVFLKLPTELYQFSPMLILLGSIIGLSILSTHRELIVMRTAGFSIRRIIGITLFAAFLLILVMASIGEGLGPKLSAKAEIHKENARNAGQAVVTASGIWFHLDNNFIHVQHVVGRQLLEGVTRYQFNAMHQLQAAYFVKQLIYEHKQWKMKEGVKTTFYPERTKSITFSEAKWDLPFNPHLFKMLDPHDMSLSRLVTFSRYLEKNGLQASEYWFDFWQRLFQPIAALVMVLLAIPFVLGSIGTAAMGRRIMAGVILGFVFFLLNAMLGQLCIVYQVPALLAASFPPILFAVVGIFLSNKIIKN